jgi:hypothetical protein
MSSALASYSGSSGFDPQTGYTEIFQNVSQVLLTSVYDITPLNNRQIQALFSEAAFSYKLKKI